MNIDLLPFIILSLAVYRITRFFIFDTLIEGLRHRWYAVVINGKRLPLVRSKIVDLTSCTWCFGVHVAYIIYALYTNTWPWDFGIDGWIVTAGLAGSAGLLSAFEPGDDE